MSLITSSTNQAYARLNEGLPSGSQSRMGYPYIFHLETDNFQQVIQTIQLACNTKCNLIPFGQLCDEIIKERKDCFDFNLTLTSALKKVISDCYSEEKCTNYFLPTFAYLDQMTLCGNQSDSISSENPRWALYCQVIKEFIQYIQTCEYIKTCEEHEKHGKKSYPGRHLFFVTYGSSCSLPTILLQHTLRIPYEPLTPDDFAKLLNECQHALAPANNSTKEKKGPPQSYSYGKELLQWYADNMSGMSELEVRRLLYSTKRIFLPDPVDFTQKEKIEPVIRAHKNRLLEESGKLVVEQVEKDDDLEGVENLKKWLNENKAAMRNGKLPPNGIALVGLPGTGKSAAAKMAARIFELPLVRLDMSRILGRYVGESEKNLAAMIEDLKIAAPCVLWIDEVEKAFGDAGGGSGESGGSGVIQRMFGMLLNFMQENKRPVFTVTTANNISKLPSEFFRSGRFDQVFSLMLPDFNGCCRIMEKRLNHYARLLGIKRQFAEVEANALMRAVIGRDKTSAKFFTGADIDARAKSFIRRFGSGSQAQDPAINDKINDKNEKGKAVLEQMEKLSRELKAEVDPSSSLSMENCAQCYLQMMQDNMCMVGSVGTEKNTEIYRSNTEIYRSNNLDIDSTRYFVFHGPDSRIKGNDDPEKVRPTCMKNHSSRSTGNNDPADMKNPSPRSTGNNDPAEWYDALFNELLEEKMCEIIIMDREHTMDSARESYWDWKIASRKAASEKDASQKDASQKDASQK